MKNVLDRIQVNGKEECFIILKDHKPLCENNATAKLINPAKREIGRISKVILENIFVYLRGRICFLKFHAFSTFFRTPIDKCA